MNSVSLITIATGSDSSHWPYLPLGEKAARCPKYPGGNFWSKAAPDPAPFAVSQAWRSSARSAGDSRSA